MQFWTDAQIGAALKTCGKYRVRRAQTVANQGAPDGISGATVLSLGIREDGLRNVNGGAIKEGGIWVPSPPARQDSGVFQISRDYHSAELRLMPAVAEGTWGPTLNDVDASYPHMCPRFEDSLQYTIRELHEAQAYGADNGVRDDDLPRFSIAAHNAGERGALDGYLGGDVDRFTAGGDYSAWVLHARRQVLAWLRVHEEWFVAA